MNKFPVCIVYSDGSVDICQLPLRCRERLAAAVLAASGVDPDRAVELSELGVRSLGRVPPPIVITGGVG